jgi:hypothetical protein
MHTPYTIRARCCHVSHFHCTGTYSAPSTQALIQRSASAHVNAASAKIPGNLAQTYALSRSHQPVYITSRPRLPTSSSIPSTNHAPYFRLMRTQLLKGAVASHVQLLDPLTWPSLKGCNRSSWQASAHTREITPLPSPPAFNQANAY